MPLGQSLHRVITPVTSATHAPSRGVRSELNAMVHAFAGSSSSLFTMSVVSRPVRRIRRGLFQGGGDDVLDLVQQDRRRSARPRLVDQPIEASVHEPATPLRHRMLPNPQGRRDFRVR